MDERSNKKAEVIAMMKRAKGATLSEIIEAMGWQKHTVRGLPPHTATGETACVASSYTVSTSAISTI